MDWQLAIVLVLVAAATLYLVRQSARSWFGKKAGGCGGGCSCGPKSTEPTLIPSEQITLRRRPQAR